MVSYRTKAKLRLGLAMCIGFALPVAAQFNSNPSFSILMPKRVSLVSKLPPVFNATGKTIVLHMVNDNGQVQQMIDARILREFTETDSSVRVGGTNPDYILDCQVLEWKDPNYVSVNDSMGSNKQLTGTLSVRFQINEVRNRSVRRSGIAKQDIAQTVSRTNNATGPTKIFGKKLGGSAANTMDYKAMSQADAQQYLMDSVARQIASYMVTTSQSLDVPLASGGALSNADKFAQGGLWPRYLETLETLPPYSDARVDAYRQYDIGVANEALAYQAQDVQAAIKYLQQASNAYGKSIDSKPEEKNFIPAQTRIKLALAHYEQLGQNSTATASAEHAAAAQPAEKPLTNSDVIDMVKAKLDQGNVVDTIQHASVTSFDLTPQGLIALSKAGVNGQIITAMKTQQRAEAQTR